MEGWREGGAVFVRGVFAPGNNIFQDLTGHRKNRDSPVSPLSTETSR